jgi:Rps23 Pro-64 3,4-dihydroxylase Tpa1-like proline 4-hydroxylase
MSEILLRFSALEVFAKPFPYFTAVEAFDEVPSAALIVWLETEAPWRLVKEDFYEQYEFSTSSVTLPKHLTFLTAPPLLDDLRLKVEHIFGVKLRERIDCTIHKLIRGQRIRIHNDFIPGQETHRVVVQLNRGWHNDQGGLLMFFNSQDPADLHRVIAPVHDSVVGFAISEDSNHAVSMIHSGERFTLVFSFYDERNS